MRIKGAHEILLTLIATCLLEVGSLTAQTYYDGGYGYGRGGYTIWNSDGSYSDVTPNYYGGY
jgi:hypothetical protein